MKNCFSKSLLSLLVSLSVLCSACLSLNACHRVPNETNDTEDESLIFSDALGREVSVKKNPQRVAALLGSFADIWCLSGGTLCAAADDAWEDFGLELDGAVRLGGAHSPGLERLLSANPDLVLASASTASNIEMKDVLETMNITVVYFDIDHFNDYLEMLAFCTTLTGRTDLYKQNGTALQKQIEAVRTDYANAALSDSERTVLLLRASSGSVKAKGSQGTVLGEMLADMGCINLADRDRSLLENLSVEVVIREEPRHIFVVTMGNDTDAAKASLETMIKENPAWGTLEAIRNNRLHIMDKTLFNLKPNARWAEAYEILYETLTSP